MKITGEKGERVVSFTGPGDLELKAYENKYAIYLQKHKELDARINQFAGKREDIVTVYHSARFSKTGFDNLLLESVGEEGSLNRSYCLVTYFPETTTEEGKEFSEKIISLRNKLDQLAAKIITLNRLFDID